MCSSDLFVFFFNDTATTVIYTLSLHDALPILLKLRRTAQERMNLENPETVSPRTLINSKTFSSAVDYFFGRSELSQVVDQANPLSQLAHERRLSALGPGGLNRKRDRKSTRLNSSHVAISYAVVCLKKKTQYSACKQQ